MSPSSVRGGWAPPGTSADPGHWRYDLKRGWLSPQEPADLGGTQVVMPPNFDPRSRVAGYHLLASPPGTQAPESAINYTPTTGEVHAPGTAAPPDELNLSMIPDTQSQPLPPDTGSTAEGSYMAGTYTDDLARRLMQALGAWSSGSEPDAGAGQVGMGQGEEEDPDAFGGSYNISPTGVRRTPPPNQWGGYPASMGATTNITPNNPIPGTQGAAAIGGAVGGAYGAVSGTPSNPYEGMPPEVASIVGAPAPPPQQPAPAPAAAAAPTPTRVQIDRSGDPSKFYASIMPYARQVEAETGIPAHIMAAMAASESNYGRAPGNMLFGIKYTGRPGTQTTGPLATWESVNGQRVNTNAEFEAYNTPEDAFRGLASFLQQNPIYATALQNTSDPDKFVQLLNQAGYATDPNWHQNISSMSRQALSAVGGTPSTGPSSSVNQQGGAYGQYGPSAPPSSSSLNLIPLKDPDGVTRRWGIPDPENPGQVAQGQSGPLTVDVNPKDLHFYNSNGHTWYLDTTNPGTPPVDLGVSDAAQALAMQQSRLELDRQQMNQPNFAPMTLGNGATVLYNSKTGQQIQVAGPNEKFQGVDPRTGQLIIQGASGKIEFRPIPGSSPTGEMTPGGYMIPNGQGGYSFVPGTQEGGKPPAYGPEGQTSVWDPNTRQYVQARGPQPQFQVVGSRYLYRMDPDGGNPQLVQTAPQGTTLTNGPGGAIYSVNQDTQKAQLLVPGRPERETINGRSIAFDAEGNARVAYEDPMSNQKVVGDQIIQYDPKTGQYKVAYQAPRQPIQLGAGKWLIPNEIKFNPLPGWKVGAAPGQVQNAYMGGGQYGETSHPWDVSGANDYTAISAGQGQDVGKGAEDMPMPSAPMGGAAVQPPGGWQPPVPPQSVVGTGNRFGQPVDMEGIHKGLDLQAVQGTPAIAPATGIVVAVQNKPDGLGQQVLIKDAQGQIHTLSHMDSIDVHEGDQVRAGQPVGTVGSSGAGSTGPHMDYRVQGPQGEYRNPEPLAGALAQMPTVTSAPTGTGQATGWGADGPDFGPFRIDPSAFSRALDWAKGTPPAQLADIMRKDPGYAKVFLSNLAEHTMPLGKALSGEDMPEISVKHGGWTLPELTEEVPGRLASTEKNLLGAPKALGRYFGDLMGRSINAANPWDFVPERMQGPLLNRMAPGLTDFLYPQTGQGQDVGKGAAEGDYDGWGGGFGIKGPNSVSPQNAGGYQDPYSSPQSAGPSPSTYNIKPYGGVPSAVHSALYDYYQSPFGPKPPQQSLTDQQMQDLVYPTQPDAGPNTTPDAVSNALNPGGANGKNPSGTTHYGVQAGGPQDNTSFDASSWRNAAQQGGLNAVQSPSQLAAQSQALGMQLQQLDLQKQSLAQSYSMAQQQLQQQWAIHQDDDRYRQQALALENQWRAADRALTAQQNELNRQMQLTIQGSFDQRSRLELYQSALRNPWLQQLSGMAPGWKMPGGPGNPSTNPQPVGFGPPTANLGKLGTGEETSPVGVGADLGSGWGTPGSGGTLGVPSQGGGTPVGPGWGPFPGSYQNLTPKTPTPETSNLSVASTPSASSAPSTSSGGGGSSTPYNPYPNMFGSTGTTGTTAAPAATSAPSAMTGSTIGSPSGAGVDTFGWDPYAGDATPSLYMNPNFVSFLAQQGITGQWVPESARQALTNAGYDVSNFHFGAKPADNGGGGGGGGIVPTAPSSEIPWEQYRAMSPFERAALRTQVESAGVAWEDFMNQLRTYWGTSGGPTDAPNMTALAAARQKPRDFLGNTQIAETFGYSPDEYWNLQKLGWAPAAASSVSLIA